MASVDEDNWNEAKEQNPSVGRIFLSTSGYT
jgi:hypothetical protein